MVDIKHNPTSTSPTIILIHRVRRLHKQRLGGVRVWLLPHPRLLGLHVQLANLEIIRWSKEHILFSNYKQDLALFIPCQG